MLKVTLYGSPLCQDTARSRDYMQALGIPFQEVNVQEDKNAEMLVKLINHGLCSTPTIILDPGTTTVILTEPTNDHLHNTLSMIYSQ